MDTAVGYGHSVLSCRGRAQGFGSRGTLRAGCLPTPTPWSGPSCRMELSGCQRVNTEMSRKGGKRDQDSPSGSSDMQELWLLLYNLSPQDPLAGESPNTLLPLQGRGAAPGLARTVLLGVVGLLLLGGGVIVVIIILRRWKGIWNGRHRLLNLTSPCPCVSPTAGTACVPSPSCPGLPQG